MLQWEQDANGTIFAAPAPKDLFVFFFCLSLAKDFPDFSFLKTVRTASGVAQGTKNTPVHLARPGYYDLVGQNFYNSFPDRIR